ncbi:MAG: 1-acyl-sn-glycerol-3-phosphate acyltransferase [Treponema sp.]|jgi:1-acyl-sn-glycerol-3-phosphate acyltransferase|nr:1-acyl-sn-glycerol-3-phosphate acyltransferase [Treponema sp.]
MSLIKTILIFIPVVAAVIFLTPIGIIVFTGSLIGLRKPLSYMMYRIAQGWARMMIKFTGCQVTVTGRENIPSKGGVCFVSNHGSIFDIVLHLAYTGRPIGFAAKKELIYIPLLNMWIYLLGGFFIDRKNIRQAVRSINKGINRIKAGGAMIIFPEGHRSRGQGLLPFRPGALKLATQAEAPIVPVALAGSYDVFERHYRLRPGPVGVHFGKPIPTAGLPPEDRKKRLADQVYRVIKEALGITGAAAEGSSPA